MEQTDKDLLFMDLSMRVPYRPMLLVEDDEYGDTVQVLDGVQRDYVCKGGHIAETSQCWQVKMDKIKPMLHSMASMPEEDRDEYGHMCHEANWDLDGSIAMIQWLLERHYDINHLIEKKLAVDADAFIGKSI